MKKIILLTGSLLVSIMSMSQQKCIIKGHIEGTINDALVVCVTNRAFTKTEYLDTVKLNNGDFTYTVTDNEMRQLVFVNMPSDGKKLFEECKDNLSLFSFPQENVEIKGTLSNYTITGSPFYKDMSDANKTIEPLMNEMLSKREGFTKRYTKETDKGKIDKEYADFYADWTKRYDATVLNFIKSHPDSDYSAMLAVNMKNDLAKEANSVLTDRAKNGPVKAYANAIYSNQKANQARAEAAKKMKEGIQAPDFTLIDINGKPLSLSSLRGQYIILDFWGSWCSWCIKGMPKMKEYYQKYKGKFQILGVACDDTDKRWKAAVAKHELPWLQVINSKDKDVSLLYGISGYPTKLVIDPHGSIVKIAVGEDPEFYTYLDKLFK